MRRKDFGKGVNWKAKKCSVAAFLTVVVVTVELGEKNESKVNCIGRHGPYCAVHTPYWI